MKRTALVLLLILLIATPAGASFTAGLAAYQKGDFQAAYRAFRDSAEQGHPDAQYRIGLMYAKGEFVARDESLAMDWLRRAAGQGHLDAQMAAGLMLIRETGPEINHTDQDIAWMRRAARIGGIEAQAGLGQKFYAGQGVPRDYTEAFLWSRRAAEQGYAPSQTLVGIMFVNGYGVPQNDEEGKQWLQLAAENGYGPALFYLGVMYAFGHGASKNLTQAYVWLSLSIDAGVDEAMSLRERIKTQMTDAQVLGAERLLGMFRTRRL